ncbi:hypothetical protein BC829DRAFT_77153 [Chytridium lagenaria]|nr:hypothetical protein BC829DRAFT_77153 [Chytridium lagenaria]
MALNTPNTEMLTLLQATLQKIPFAADATVLKDNKADQNTLVQTSTVDRTASIEMLKVILDAGADGIGTTFCSSKSAFEIICSLRDTSLVEKTLPAILSQPDSQDLLKKGFREALKSVCFDSTFLLLQAGATLDLNYFPDVKLLSAQIGALQKRIVQNVSTKQVSENYGFFPQRHKSKGYA